MSTVAGLLLWSSPAQAGQSQTVCLSAPLPTGWVITGYFDWYTCGTPDSYLYSAKKIMDIQDTPTGGSVTACITPMPAGFYSTGFSYSFSCEATKTPDRMFNNQQVVTNLNGLPAGYTTIICGVQQAPPGWTVVAVVQSYRCVYARGAGVGQNGVSIRKL